MTGYKSKRAAAQDKLEQWDTPSEAFNEWWNGEYDDSTNPFTKHSLAYWAFAGWQAALAQPEQEQDATMQSLKDLWRSVCDGVGKAAFAQPAQEPTLQEQLTEEQIWKCNRVLNENGEVVGGVHICLDHQNVVDFARAIEREIGFSKAKLKEKNNG